MVLVPLKFSLDSLGMIQFFSFPHVPVPLNSPLRFIYKFCITAILLTVHIMDVYQYKLISTFKMLKKTTRYF